jgi:hemerythrin-like domain-containing protein
VRRSSALLKLSREHHTALSLALRIARAVDPEAQASLLADVPRLFREKLEPHFQEEELDLLPRLAEVGEQELVDRTLAEHRQMRQLVAQMGAGEVPALKDFGLLLKAHVQFEERELFVQAQAVLGPDYLDKHV